MPPPSGADQRHRRIWPPTAAYAAGLVGSTTAVGAGVGTLGVALRTHLFAGDSTRTLWVVGIAVVAFAYGLHELALIHLPTPQVQWQVPAHWSHYGKTAQALLYGGVLGAEVFTFIPYAAFYILVLIDMVLGSKGGAVLGCLYGLARVASTVVGIVLARHRGSTGHVIARVAGAIGLFHRANGVALIVVGVVLGGMLVGR